MGENDRRVVQADEIDLDPGGRHDVGAQAEEIREIEGALGEDREVDVAHVAPVGIHGGAVQKDELHSFVTRQHRAGGLLRALRGQQSRRVALPRRPALLADARAGEAAVRCEVGEDLVAGRVAQHAAHDGALEDELDDRPR